MQFKNVVWVGKRGGGGCFQNARKSNFTAMYVACTLINGSICTGDESSDAEFILQL